MKKNQLLGSFILLLTAFIWGTAFIFQRTGMDSITPITFTAARMSLSAVAVGAVSLLIRGRAGFADEAEHASYVKYTVIGGICCGIFLALAATAQQMGLVYTTAGKAGFITAMYMLFVPVINLVLFRKRGTWLMWAGVALGLIGMYLLCMKGSFRLSHGDVLVFICAVLFSGHIICCDHFVGRGHAVRISAIQFVVTAVITWIAAFILEAPAVGQIRSAVLPILYCGIVSGGAGYTLQIIGQKYTGPTVASILMSLESVFAAISGAVFLHEQMSRREVAGCVIMFIAIIVVQLPAPGKQPRERAGESAEKAGLPVGELTGAPAERDGLRADVRPGTPTNDIREVK